MNKKAFIKSGLFIIVQIYFVCVQAVQASEPLISLEGLKKENMRDTQVFDGPISKPLILGHRGASGYRPEHTIESYSLAIEMGADFIETDLVSTKDGVLMARHEYEIGDTTNVADVFPERKTTKTVDGVEKEGWYIEDFTYQEIQDRIRAKERLPYRNQSYNGKLKLVRFDEILDLVQQKEKEFKRKIGVYVEIKHSTYFRSLHLPLTCTNAITKSNVICNVEDKLLETLSKYHYDQPSASPVIIESFEISNLIELRNKIGKNSPYKLIQLLDEPQMQPGELIGKPGENLNYNDMLSVENLERMSKYADVVGPWKRMIVREDPTSHKLLEPNSVIKNAHDAGLLVHVYTFRSDVENLAPEYGGDPTNEYLQFLKLGVDGIFTDFTNDGIKARNIFLNSAP